MPATIATPDAANEKSAPIWAASWIGPAGKARAIQDPDGDPILGSTLPAAIYQTVMKAASVGAPGDAFDPPAFVGDPKSGDAPSPVKER